MGWKAVLQKGPDQYRYNLEFWDYGLYDREKKQGEILQAALKYQGWAMGGCSTAQLWGWIHVPTFACTKEHLVGFIDALKPIASASMYNPHMFFAQLPEEGREGFSSAFWKFMLAEVFPNGLQPAYTYENRAHASTLQRLYYVDTIPLYRYAEKYHAEQKLLQEKPAGDNSVPNVGTIIKPRPVQDNTGVQFDQYFDAGL